MNIVDIDFRYVMKVVPVPELGDGIGIRQPVLQWRKMVTVTAFGEPTTTKWTEWQDVRTEEEHD